MVKVVFAYGTLRDPAVQTEVWGRVTPGRPDVLRGWRLSFIETDEGVYPLVIPDADSRVAGELLTVTDEELAKIDAYETAAYRRERLVLESGSTAWVYVQAPGQERARG